MLMRLVKVYLMESSTSRAERQPRATPGPARHAARPSTSASRLSRMLAGMILLYVAGLIVLNGQLGVAAITLATALVCLYFPLSAWLENRKIMPRSESAEVLFVPGGPGEVGQVVGASPAPCPGS
jgi:predicted lipid-binding transport protein (Tim44 family)